MLAAVMAAGWVGAAAGWSSPGCRVVSPNRFPLLEVDNTLHPPLMFSVCVAGFGGIPPHLPTPTESAVRAFLNVPAINHAVLLIALWTHTV